jgi:hypothetical protein
MCRRREAHVKRPLQLANSSYSCRLPHVHLPCRRYSLAAQLNALVFQHDIEALSGVWLEWRTPLTRKWTTNHSSKLLFNASTLPPCLHYHAVTGNYYHIKAASRTSQFRFTIQQVSINEIQQTSTKQGHRDHKPHTTTATHNKQQLLQAANETHSNSLTRRQACRQNYSGKWQTPGTGTEGTESPW